MMMNKKNEQRLIYIVNSEVYVIHVISNEAREGV